MNNGDTVGFDYDITVSVAIGSLIDFAVDPRDSNDLNDSTYFEHLIEFQCDGDANSDDLIDPLDAGFIQARFGCSVGTGDDLCDDADVNSDGIVDPLDVGYVLARFGECSQ